MVMNWNLNIQQNWLLATDAFSGYVGSRSVHLSVASDDINLVQPTAVRGVGFVFPCDPSQVVPYEVTPMFNTCANNQTGTRIDSNWGAARAFARCYMTVLLLTTRFNLRLKKTLSQVSKDRFRTRTGNVETEFGPGNG